LDRSCALSIKRHSDIQLRPWPKLKPRPLIQFPVRSPFHDGYGPSGHASLGSTSQEVVFKRLNSTKHIPSKEHQIAQHQHREAGVEMRNRERNPVNERSENCENEGNQERQLSGRCQWPIKHRVLPGTRKWAKNDISLPREIALRTAFASRRQRRGPIKRSNTC